MADPQRLQEAAPPRVHRISIDPSKPLAQEPHTGHNRWHEAIEPRLEVEPGEVVVLETRDAFDGQVDPRSTAADVGAAALGPVHPLTGPVYVKGAEPGDLLDVKILQIDPDPFESWGYTVQVPGFGFLADQFPDPYIAHWRLIGGYAESAEVPGVRIRFNPFPGTIGLAPSAELRRRATERESVLVEQGLALPPDPEGAVPDDPAIAREALRTIPPRETGGNLDIKQMTPGASVLIPVHAEGGLLSVGDVHYAQGDCEACGTAIEMRSAVHLQCAVRKGEATRTGTRSVQLVRDDYFADAHLAAPRRFHATTGFPVTAEGEQRSGDLTLAARNALLEMIAHLGDRGYDRQQAYTICSVAVDLRVSQVVDVPNFVVAALLPLDIFM
jgi:formamidase